MESARYTLSITYDAFIEAYASKFGSMLKIKQSNEFAGWRLRMADQNPIHRILRAYTLWEN